MKNIKTFMAAAVVALTAACSEAPADEVENAAVAEEAVAAGTTEEAAAAVDEAAPAPEATAAK
jgi:hypothetical protein